ncbi:hypothetical protein Tco_1005783 [Tanacetum coccineum]|uniref:Uncharacterized protein n=1 Tax=Tanacetum coccineum TaxID=301880 RepID=A0ABQ5FH12_9ASTR
MKSGDAWVKNDILTPGVERKKRIHRIGTGNQTFDVIISIEIWIGGKNWRGNRKIRIPIAMWPCRVEEKMTLKEVNGQTVEEIKIKIIAKDGTITRVPGKFQGYETSEEE